MTAKRKIAAISGSTRLHSSNHQLLQALAGMLSGRADLTIFDSIAALPHFNPDLDGDHSPAAVTSFRQFLRDSDGILICTPEYAHGVPGSLKNAIDWTASSCEFSHKPTVLITAATEGRMGHQALLETLRTIEAGHIEELQLVIPFIRTKLDAGGGITDAATRKSMGELMDRFMSLLA